MDALTLIATVLHWIAALMLVAGMLVGAAVSLFVGGAYVWGAWTLLCVLAGGLQRLTQRR